MGKTNLKMSIHNRFDIEVIDKDTGKVKQKAVAYNVVCNAYYSAIFNRTRAENILIGGGSGTPAATDSALFSYIGYCSTTDGSDTIDDSEEYRGIWRRILKRTIQYNQYVNQTITEVGLATGTSGTICTHAMLQDMNGNPISILHTNTDIINVYCNIYLHYSGQNGDIHLYAVKPTYDAYWGRYNTVKYYGFVHMALLSNIFGQTNYYTWGIILAATRGQLFYNYQSSQLVVGVSCMPISVSSNVQNKTLTLTASRLPTGNGNMQGIQALTLHHTDSGGSSYYGTPDLILDIGKTTIPPANITNESLGIGDGSTTKFKTKFIRPYNAKVYINGVEVASGVTVQKAIPVMQANNQNITYPTSIQENGTKVSLDFLQYIKVLTPKNINLPMADPHQMDYLKSYAPLKYGSVIEFLENEIGFYRIGASNGSVKGSNDGETWVDVETNTSDTQMNQAGAHYRYYKFNGGEVSLFLNTYDGYNVIFDTPPANGDVITIDYKTDSIPKDADHVLDASITFTFGEWTGE